MKITANCWSFARVIRVIAKSGALLAAPVVSAQPDLISTYLPGASYIGSGWYDSQWFGAVYPSSQTDFWGYHEHHEWIYFTGTGPENLWIWEDKLGWWWYTNSTDYPAMCAPDNNWYYYYDGAVDPRPYWSYTHASWRCDLFFDVPDYSPTYWNDGWTIQYGNNCYNYACNRRTDTFAQPGRGAGEMYDEITVSEIAVSALLDGLESGTAWGPVPQGKTRVALVVKENYDYHWYRQDETGAWSHKPGGTQVRDYDASSDSIKEVELADWGIYDQFGGYFFVDSDDSQGQGNENIN